MSDDVVARTGARRFFTERILEMSEQVQLVGSGAAALRVEQGSDAIVIRLEGLPATPQNLERIQERVRRLNRRLAESGAQFRLRVI